MNNNIFEILKDENKLIDKIKELGFDILEKYNVINEYIKKYDNGLIKVISFEIKDNPLDTDWDWNGCIGLLFEYKDNEVSCQLQLDAITNIIDYSDYAKYTDYNNMDFNPPNFKNETDGYGEFDCNTRCDFGTFIDVNNFKTIKILNKITKSIIALDEILEDCIDTQDEIDQFESKYYDLWTDIELEDKYGKDSTEISDEEWEEYIEEKDGIATYNMMVREGWIDED